VTTMKKVEARIRETMKSQDRERLSALRMIKAELLLKDKESEKGLDDNPAEQALRKMYNKYKKAKEEYISLGKQEEADRYSRDLEVIEGFMSTPMMSEDQIKQALEEVTTELEASDPKDFGRVMKAFMSAHSNADGKVVSSLLKEILNK